MRLSIVIALKCIGKNMYFCQTWNEQLFLNINKLYFLKCIHTTTCLVPRDNQTRLINNVYVQLYHTENQGNCRTAYVAYNGLRRYNFIKVT